MRAVAAINWKKEEPTTTQSMMPNRNSLVRMGAPKLAPMLMKKEEEDAEEFKDVLALPGDLIDNDLVNTLMSQDDDELTKNTSSLDALARGE